MRIVTVGTRRFLLRKVVITDTQDGSSRKDITLNGYANFHFDDAKSAVTAAIELAKAEEGTVTFGWGLRYDLPVTVNAKSDIAKTLSLIKEANKKGAKNKHVNEDLLATG